jgi:hypothetical protein
MKFGQLLVVLVSFLLVSSVYSTFSLPSKAETQTMPKTYFGVDIAFQGVSATEQIIDKVCNFTNLVVFGSTNTTYDDVALTQVCDYALDKGIYFIVFTAWNIHPSKEWIAAASNQWGNHFLGFYIDDELGGKQLENSTFQFVKNAVNVTDAQAKFTQGLGRWLSFFPGQSNWPIFTSDYALHYFDYQAGYDTVFAEYVGGYSRQMAVAQVRGAATAQGKDWGAMITNAANVPDLYAEPGPDLYNDTRYAYDNGAKYIIVFDSDKNYTQNVLGQEQFDAMSQFWQYMQNHPQTNSPISERTAYVLPAGYAYGFRGPQDKIWGLWPGNMTSFMISTSVSIMLDRYGANLDIIYEDALRSGNSFGYGNIFYWNDQNAVASEWPSFSPWPGLTSTETPTLTLPAESSNQTTHQTSLSSDQPRAFQLSDEYIWIAAIGISVACAGGTALVLKRRQNGRN